jgi:hypothetical protein
MIIMSPWLGLGVNAERERLGPTVGPLDSVRYMALTWEYMLRPHKLAITLRKREHKELVQELGRIARTIPRIEFIEHNSWGLDRELTGNRLIR